MKATKLLKMSLCLSASLAVMVSSGIAQQLGSPDTQSRSKLGDEFILERISGNESPEQISDSQAIQVLMSLLINYDPFRIKNRMASTKITDEQSAELKKIAGESFLFYERIVRSGLSDICNSEEYGLLLRERNDPQSLIDLMERLEGSTSAAFQEFFR